MEPGTRGFWLDYPNINRLVSHKLKLNETDVFTNYTTSAFFSPAGLEVEAPIFQNLPCQLPSPLGQVFGTFPLFKRLPLVDRASMAGLLLACVDCVGACDEKVKVKYDKVSGYDLLKQVGCSERLIDDFIRPTLLVGLFKPPEELSALVVMELLYFYALAHTTSFDVRWIKNGTVADSILAPLAELLVEENGLDVKGGCFVEKVEVEEEDHGVGEHNSHGGSTVKSITYFNKATQQKETIEPDGVVFALGNKGLKSVVKASPDLAKIPAMTAAASLGAIDVVSVRIWLDKRVTVAAPANVFSKFKELRGAGGTFFMLDQLQEENEAALWAGEEVQGSVVACDFYNADQIVCLSEEEIVRTLMEDLLPKAVPEFATANVVDSWVGKFPQAVTWFSPGSYGKRPTLNATDTGLSKVKFCGDVVRMGKLEHGAKGLW